MYIVSLLTLYVILVTGGDFTFGIADPKIQNYRVRSVFIYPRFMR